jgi:DNA-binding transcriptional MerR regulator
MEINHNPPRLYTPAEICRMFGISRTTLFRWERSEEISLVARDSRGERYYTVAHLRQIGQRILRDRYDRAHWIDDPRELEQDHKAMILFKLRIRDETGVPELKEFLPTLTNQEIENVLSAALETYKPGEPLFLRILEAVTACLSRREKCHVAVAG